MAKPNLNSNAMYAYRYLQDKYQLKPHQAAAVVGNLMQESTMNTGAKNPGDGRDGTDSIGIGQWNGQRARNLRGFAGENAGSLDTQLDFVMHEMSGKGDNGGGSEAYAYNKLMGADNVHDATAAMISYERPAGWSRANPTAGHGFDNRLSWAGETLGMSPDQVAAAKPQSSQPPVVQAGQAPQAQAQAVAATDERGIGKKIFDRVLGTETPEQAKASVLPKLLPDEFMGVNTKKGINLLGALGGAFAGADQTNTLNQQAQQSAQAGQARRGQAQPVEMGLMSSLAEAKNEVPGGMDALAGLTPEELMELLKKQKMGGLGGLGGWRV
ncbi:phage tail tip lysozyme [Agrobacterium sp. rho-8.1]|nr:phage tail tip lysozyme [Agrobacterium sp. rho-8.1]